MIHSSCFARGGEIANMSRLSRFKEVEADSVFPLLEMSISCCARVSQPLTVRRVTTHIAHLDENTIKDTHNTPKNLIFFHVCRSTVRDTTSCPAHTTTTTNNNNNNNNNCWSSSCKDKRDWLLVFESILYCPLYCVTTVAAIHLPNRIAYYITVAISNQLSRFYTFCKTLWLTSERQVKHPNKTKNHSHPIITMTWSHSNNSNNRLTSDGKLLPNEQQQLQQRSMTPPPSLPSLKDNCSSSVLFSSSSSSSVNDSTPTRSHRSNKMSPLDPSLTTTTTTTTTRTLHPPIIDPTKAIMEDNLNGSGIDNSGCGSSLTKSLTKCPPPPKSSDGIGVNELAYAELAEMRNGTVLHSSPSNKHHHSNRPQFFPVACRSLLMEIEGNQKCLDCGTLRPEWAALSYGALVCINCSGNHRSLGVQTSMVRHITMDHWTYPQVIQMLEGGNAQLQNFFERHALTQAAFQRNQQKGLNGTDTPTTSTTTTSHTYPISSPSKGSSPPRQFATNNNNSSNNNGSKSSSSSSPTTTTTSSMLTTDNLPIMRYKTKAALFYRQQLYHHVQQLLGSGQPYQGRRDRKIKRRPLGTQRSTVS
jgi:Putative GTPase activating protein for Arf